MSQEGQVAITVHLYFSGFSDFRDWCDERATALRKIIEEELGNEDGYVAEVKVSY